MGSLSGSPVLSPSQIGDTQPYSPSPSLSPPPFSLPDLLSRESSFCVVPSSQNARSAPGDSIVSVSSLALVPSQLLATPLTIGRRDLYALNGPYPRRVPETPKDKTERLGKERLGQSSR